MVEVVRVGYGGCGEKEGSFMFFNAHFCLQSF